MKSNRFVVHLTPTPLVGAPARIVSTLNQFTTYNAVNIVLRDYPGPLKGKFLFNSINADENATTKELAIEMIASADIIHIHNFLPSDWSDVLKRTFKRQIFIYHVHSPLKEGPTYFDWSNCLPFEPAARLVIGQWPQRLYQSFRFVPNIVPESATVRYVSEGEEPTILFSPSHRRVSRWGSKTFDGIDDRLSELEAGGGVRVRIAEGIEQQTLLALRRRTQISIDDVATGGFHQVSLEAMVAGNIVINGAEESNIHALRSTLRCDFVPFHHVDETTFVKVLRGFINDPDRLREEQQRTHEFASEYLSPERLVSRFTDIYDEVLA